MQETTLWVVGQYKGECAVGQVWELAGVYTTENAAVAACRNESYFVGPVQLNVPIPRESVDWPGAYYPFAQVG